jgi:tRNA A37 threonylcarbamoyladenosine dehydratase
MQRMSTEQRTRRFKDIYTDTLNHVLKTDHIVVGAGSTGGKVIQLLAQIGVTGTVYIFDDDIIEDVNIAPQGFSPRDIGRAKVDVRERQFKHLNAGTCQIHKTRLGSHNYKHFKFPEHAYWWSMVDSLSGREQILEAAVEFDFHRLIDCRMSGLMYEVYCINSEDSTIEMTKKYIAQIEWAKEHPMDEGCSTKSTPHIPMICAGIALNLALQHKPPFKVEGDLLTYKACMSL